MGTRQRTHRKFLKSKDVRQLASEAQDKLGRRPVGESVEQETLPGDVQLYLVGGKPELLRVRGRLVPSLSNNGALDLLPSIAVDMGAIPYVCNGADVMAPGIRRVDGAFDRDALVVIRDERHGKALAIGIALLSSEELKQTKKGKSIENLHYVGDELWEAYK